MSRARRRTAAEAFEACRHGIERFKEDVPIWKKEAPRLRRRALGDGELMGRDLAIDLGTANTLVYRQGDGIVFNEPTVVALHGGTGEVLAMGDEVWDLIGGAPATSSRSGRCAHGAMTEFDITQRMLEVVVQPDRSPRASRSRGCWSRPLDELRGRAAAPIEEAIRFAGGGRSVTLVEEPLAAAIGAGLPIHEPIGNLIVDIGGGRSEMAVVSMGGVVSGRSIALGGFDLDAAIQEHIRERYGVAIGETAAEEIKIAIGSAFPSSTGTAARSSPGASWPAATPSR